MIAALVVVAAAAGASAHTGVAGRRYIVRFKVKAETVAARGALLASSPPRSINVTTSFGRVLNGGFAADLSPDGIAFLKAHPGVLVEQAGTMHALLPLPREPAERFSSARTSADAESPIVSGATPWGLDRIDQPRLPLNDLYAAADLPLDTVHAFVIDTGMYRAHDELRASVSTAPLQHFSAHARSDGAKLARDRVGHGTHCAGLLGGQSVGVAPGVHLHAVKVLGDDGSGSNEDVIAGMDWVAAYVQAETQRTGRRLPAVASMSLGGSFSHMINDAVADLVAHGVVVVVAAGNDADDACNYSPASAAAAISVGSSTRSDEPSFFTNYGRCVDIFGPGSDVLSAGIRAADAYVTMSGTSSARRTRRRARARPCRVTTAVKLMRRVRPPLAPRAQWPRRTLLASSRSCSRCIRGRAPLGSRRSSSRAPSLTCSRPRQSSRSPT